MDPLLLWFLIYVAGFITSVIICRHIVVKQYGKEGWTSNEKGTAIVLSTMSWIMVILLVVVKNKQ